MWSRVSTWQHEFQAALIEVDQNDLDRFWWSGNLAAHMDSNNFSAGIDRQRLEAK
jgi:hypothetical protein